MEIHEVEEILGSLKLLGLLAPQYVVLVDKLVPDTPGMEMYFEQMCQEREIPKKTAIVVGANPGYSSAIILSRQVRKRPVQVQTIVHEWAHARLHLHDEHAYPIDELFELKYRIMQNFPLLQWVRIPVRYEEVAPIPEIMERMIERGIKVYGPTTYYRRKYPLLEHLRKRGGVPEA